VKQLGPHAVAFVPLEGDPLLLVTPAWDRARSEEASAFAVEAVDDFGGAVRKAARTWRDARTGLVAGRDPLLGEPERWEQWLGAAPVRADAVVVDVAEVRDEWSLAAIAEGVEIAEAGYERALEVAKPGLPEHVLHAEVDVRTRELGAEDNFLLLSSSQHNRCVHQPTDRLLETGDIVLVENTPGVRGEYIQICRTFVVGREPTALEQERFDLLDACLDNSLAAATPGTPVADVVAEMNAPLVAAGFERYARPPYMRTRGHANGLGPSVPEVAPQSGHVLRERMTFELHPNQYFPDVGYLMCGEPVIVETSGARPLTSKRGTLDWC
jgi:Xaa-Pro aminopeptidase